MEDNRYTVVSKPAFRELGVMIDAKLKSRQHLEYACQKVASATAKLAEYWQAETLLKVTSSPSGAIRSDLHVKDGGACRFSEKEENESGLVAVCSTFRTTLDKVVLIVAGILSLDILIYRK